LEKSSTSAVRLWKRIRPEEYLSAAFAVALALVITFAPGYGWGDLGRQFSTRVGDYVGTQLPWILLAGAVVGGAIAWTAWKRRLSKFGEVLRDAAPFLLAYLAYVLLRDLIPLLRPVLMDDRLARLEEIVFGGYSFVALPRALGSAALDVILMGCYMSHYYVPPAFAIFLAIRNRPRFRLFMLALTITWALGYLGYLAVPAIGPKYYFSNYELWRSSAAVQPALAIIENFSSVTRDCFPSQHVAWTVLVLWAGWRYRIFPWIYLPVAAGLAVATIYFGFHYLVDVPAGVLLAVLSILLARRLHDWWNRSDSAILAACASAPSASGSPPASACSSSSSPASSTS
jgi:membrane-associated phospholipid phosphatase